MYVNDNNHFDLNFDKETFKGVSIIINESKIYRLSLVTIRLITTVATLYVLYKFSFYMEKLFLNIHDNETPFNSENVFYLKRITLYVLLLSLIPDVSVLLMKLLYNINVEVEFNPDHYLFILILIIVVYIFKYGYEIQLDSKGKIYNSIED